MCSYCKRHNETEVPDPYYGGQQGFEKVIQKFLYMFVLDIWYSGFLHALNRILVHFLG